MDGIQLPQETTESLRGDSLFFTTEFTFLLRQFTNLTKTVKSTSLTSF